jgi:hypothetical protein
VYSPIPATHSEKICSGIEYYENMYEFLATEECGVQGIMKKMLAGKYPLNGLPDAAQE